MEKVDEKNRMIYSKPRTLSGGPYIHYKTGFDGTGFLDAYPGEDGPPGGKFSANHDFFTDTYSTAE
ncbi:MAG: hypothetical protein U0T82_06185 [Bacteroidales bacterium]